MNLSDLKAPFAPDKVSWRVGSTTADKSKGMALCYIDARDVQDRLDEVCGVDGWQCRYVPMHDKKTVCEIGIRLLSPLTQYEWVWKSDGAGDSDIEAEKGALSDAFKRAAVRWGIGRYLYDLDSPWVELDTYEKQGKVFAKGIKASERKRLEALLAKGVGQPNTAPTKPQEAQTPVPVPQTQAPTITPENWLKEVLARVPKMDRETLDAFSDKQADRLARVRTLHPDLHGQVIKAIGKRQEELF